MNKLRLFVNFVLIAIISLLFISSNLSRDDLPEYQSLLPDFGKLPIAKVEKIIDGDTVRLDIFSDNSCRLAGVNTPETDKKEFYCEQSCEFLINLLTNESCWVEEFGRGKYGRHIVCLYRVPDGLFVNLEIVRQGYGKTFMEGELKSELPRVFNDYQEMARQARKGIWKNIPPPSTTPVWITKSGKKYHSKYCKYITNSDTAYEISLDEAKRKCLEPCKLCNPPE